MRRNAGVWDVVVVQRIQMNATALAVGNLRG
jgi:hypothetical protein